MLLQHGVMAQASARPDAVAIVFEDTRITYGALDARSNGLAHLLLDAGCQRGDRIALLLPKSPMAIVAMLAVLKCDAIYVPMDPASPPARLAKMLEISDCRFVLAAGAVEERLARALVEARLRKPPTVGWLDE
ncbi:MAG: AMP-binding protein, partial [Steroidobacteraceae bacterium]